ncbi:MAG: hypothetical protein DRG78_21750 [Epsilonproteobacteria bacterium]|nr:MAG: hypothetical protein DRG78_21750 [Campylobacterota bacterium]
MKEFLVGLLIFTATSTTMLANDDSVDCLILEDENSIICKYIQSRVNYDKKVKIKWIEPDGKITRIKELIIPAGHGSIYDYRYIKGRAMGTWTFQVIDEQQEFKTTFTIE